jgi:DNA-binding transcriptional ArsR family regulator
METVQTELQIDTELLKKSRRVLRAINHPLRQQIIQLIHASERMIVTEIYYKLKLEQSVASQHLAILRRENIVIAKREGKFIYYSVNYQRIKEIEENSRKITSAK